MMLKNTATTWGAVTRLLHWVVGLGILAMLAYGYWMNHFAARPDRYFHRSIHADIGYVILLLTALRLIWRVINPSPAFPQGPSWLEKALAHANHVALYTLTFLVTGLGWHCPAHQAPITRAGLAFSMCRNSQARIARKPTTTRSGTSTWLMCCSR